jgi:hypothetical protein
MRRRLLSVVHSQHTKPDRSVHEADYVNPLYIANIDKSQNTDATK